MLVKVPPITVNCFECANTALVYLTYNDSLAVSAQQGTYLAGDCSCSSLLNSWATSGSEWVASICDIEDGVKTREVNL
jgi:hypothetical protein